MIGRGTRLCTDLLGIGMDKEYFLIFDYCGNVDFFRENPNGYEGCIVTSLDQKLFNIKIDIIKTLQDFKYSDKEYMDFREQLVDEIYRKIRKLPYESYQVKLKRKYVEKYKNKGSFNFLNAKDVVDLKANISQFMMSFGEDELAKRFDFVIYTIELARINNENATKSIKHVIDTANKLAMLGTIPQVKAQKQIIDKVKEELFWKDISLSRLEEVRISIRDLILYLEKDIASTYYTCFEDMIITENTNGAMYDINDLKDYKAKVEHYLKQHINDINVNSEQLTEEAF